MRFKYLILAFSIIIVIILLAMAFMPLIINGQDSLLNLWVIILPVTVLMVLLLIILGLFFIFNYRLFSLLEKEDWPALAYYLEHQVYVKKRYNERNVKLLASSYMVISDYQSVLRLESKVSIAKPVLVDKNILIFGSARILSKKYEDAALFFKTHLGKGFIKGNDKEWVTWFYGFSYLLNGSFSKAEPEFLSLANKSGNAVITGLSAYFLSDKLAKHSLKPYECTAIAENGKNRVLDALKSRQGWKKETAKMETEIFIAIIRKYIDETEQWIFNSD